MFCWPAIESAPAHACTTAVHSRRSTAQGHAVGSRRQFHCRRPTCEVGQGLRGTIRMNSYRHVQPECASRKVVRLIHAVRSIVYEVYACPNSALLRENELLRLH